MAVSIDLYELGYSINIKSKVSFKCKYCLTVIVIVIAIKTTNNDFWYMTVPILSINDITAAPSVSGNLTTITTLLTTQHCFPPFCSHHRNSSRAHMLRDRVQIEQTET